MEDSYNLVEIVDEKTKKVRTKSLDMSFNELLDMYNDKELIIDPEYQRLFRWSEEKQSQFIESDFRDATAANICNRKRSGNI